jgi:hypothetical protein
LTVDNLSGYKSSTLKEMEGFEVSDLRWGRAHAAAHDMTDKEYAEVVAARYRQAPRWAGYEIAVCEAGPGRYFVAAAIPPVAHLAKQLSGSLR